MSKTVLTYSNATKLEYLNFIDAEAIKPGEWNITAKADGGDGDNLLEPGEIFTIIAQVNDGFPVNDKARLEIKPPIGAVLGLQRTAPPQLDDWNVLK
jgi:archaellin